MHYIRFLKLPKFVAPKSGDKSFYELTAKITITNDLGELFLSNPLPLEVILLVHIAEGKQQRITHQLEWQAYSRALDINLAIPSKYLRNAHERALPCELIVGPLQNTNSDGTERRVKGASLGAHEEGRVICVYSEEFGLDGLGTNTATVRRLVSRSHQNTMVIREEKGESIARHIWDAGIILSELLHTLIQDKPGFAERLPRCSAALKRKDLKAIELGTGVGLVGISLAHIIAQADYGSAKVLLTDLDEAREIVEMNITAATEHNQEMSLSFEELDWTKPIPEGVASETWDVVLIADCTYNPDYAQALVNTIKSLLNQNERAAERESLVLLAMKPRHVAENVFFEYMEQAGIRTIEESRIPVPVLGDESQEIRIFGFGLS